MIATPASQDTFGPEERARFVELIDQLDIAVASRPDLLGSPVGFVVGALVGAGRQDPADAWRQLAGFADLLAYVVMFVRGHPDASAEAVIGALIPPAG